MLAVSAKITSFAYKHAHHQQLVREKRRILLLAGALGLLYAHQSHS